MYQNGYIPTQEQEVSEFLHVIIMNAFVPTKATGIDGLGPRTLKMAADRIGIQTSSVPSHLKAA